MAHAGKDRAPIDQAWIRDYCDHFIEIAQQLPPNSPLREAVLLRVEYLQDLVEVWQLRNVPMDERKRG